MSHCRCLNLESKTNEKEFQVEFQVPDMSKRHFVAVYTDSGCLCACDHKHQNVTTATACISQPGGYVVAVRGRKYFPLTDAERAEFESAMYGREAPSRVPELPLLTNTVKVRG